MAQRIIIRSNQTRRRRRQLILLMLAATLLALFLVPAPERTTPALLAQAAPSADIS